ncbi:MAG: PIN domain-containing protein [Luteitalea sp.]|nr:PIN domain-containing protein [Luteitalea sp.]
MRESRRYLLDTMVVSETRKVRADPRIVSFLSAADASSLFISVLTVGELRKGVEVKRRTDPDAAARIGSWVDGIELSFVDRVLPIDTPTARRWGEISADRTRPVIDTLIAATALVHGCTLVTRNTNDVQETGVPLIDPWRTDAAP